MGFAMYFPEDAEALRAGVSIPFSSGWALQSATWKAS